MVRTAEGKCVFKPRKNAIETACSCTLISRNVRIHGRRTSIRLEPTMWTAFYDIARREGVHIDELVTHLSENKTSKSSLTAMVRVFILAYYKEAATESGHLSAKHGDLLRL